MRARSLALVASLVATAAFAACNLNPQPLPPADLGVEDPNGAGSASDASFRGDAEATTNPPPSPKDAGANLEGGNADGDGAADGGDGGDADGGDAGDLDGG